MQATFTIPTTILAQLGVSTVTLPLGAVGVPYSAQCAATGGLPPYTWTATGLPAGLSISPSGLISGTPTAAGSGQATLTATDASGI